MNKLGMILFMPLLLAGILPGQTVHFPYDSRILFNSDFSGNNEIYLISANQITRLTDNSWEDSWPVPDSRGERIVYTANKNGNWDIFMMDLRSRAITQLTKEPVDEMSPSWSYDDRYVYYDYKQGGDWVTMKLELKSGAVSPLFPNPPFSSTIVCFQNHGGDEFFFTGKAFIGWIVARYQAKTGQYSRLAEQGGACRPKVSPDDKKICYVSGEDDGLGDVWMMNPDGSGKTNLTKQRTHFYDYYPCFSPDGNMIAFSSSPKSKGKQGYDLYRLNLKTGKVKLVFASPGNDAHPVWFK